MGVLKAKVNGLWVPISAAAKPSAGQVYGIDHYRSILAANTTVLNTNTNLITIPMPAAPAGTLLDISWTIYQNQQAVGSGSTFYSVSVGPAAGALTLVTEDRVSLLSYSARTPNISPPVGVAYNVVLIGVKASAGGTVVATATNTQLGIVSYRP